MQKLQLTLLFFLLPVLILPDFNPASNLIVIGILFEIKVVLFILVTVAIAGCYSVIALVKLLLKGWQRKHWIELGISIFICFGCYLVAKEISKNLHKKPLRLLRADLMKIQDLKRLSTDLLEIRQSIISIYASSMQLLEGLKRRQSFAKVKKTYSKKIPILNRSHEIYTL